MLLLGDCNDQLKDIKDNSIDLLLTDPPYGLVSEEYREGKNHKGGFMGKDWDVLYSYGNLEGMLPCSQAG